MILFWSIIIAMIIIALGFILIPLLNKNPPVLLDHAEYNLKLYQNRLHELSVQNSIGAIENIHYQVASNELQRQLLDETQDQPKSSKVITHRSFGTATLLLFIVPIVALMLYLHWGDSKQVQQLLVSQDNIAQAAKLRAQLGSPQQVILQLQQHLQQTPQSSEGWYLLGRLYASQQQLNDASTAFAHAYQLAPQNVDILMNYAEVLSLQNNDHITNQAAKMLQEILILQPDNDAARNLLAIYAYQQKDYQTAIKYWEKILPHYSVNSSDGQAISQAIAKTQKLINASKST
jgi:cytochrome c-type biogenesis protein CcmH